MRYVPMSFDLLFWRQGENGGSPEEIAAALSDGRAVDGLAPLPVDQIMARVKASFPLLTDGGLTFWEGDADGVFEVHRSPQHVHFCCRQLVSDHCNALIGIMAGFECPLYDPQVNQRFDGGTAGT